MRVLPEPSEDGPAIPRAPPARPSRKTARRLLAAVVVIAALLLHAAALRSAWAAVVAAPGARDFASFHYAARAAWNGDDPYDGAVLARLARADGTRRGVFPFFYPPPFLLAMAWTLPLELSTAYRAWFVLDELCLLAILWILRVWWRPLGAAVPVVLAATVAALDPIRDNAAMGQVNLLVLLPVVAGLWLAERGRAAAGGALLGAACMAKMAPALLVAWWLGRGRGRRAAVAWACVAAAALSVAALAVSAPEATWRFYTRVLPTFGSSYNGLAVPIGFWSNHSLPNLWWQALGGGPHHLSAAARAASLITTVALLAALALAFRREPRDLHGRLGQIAAVILVMLLAPLYCYEHHLVWALVPIAALALALLAGRLPRPWALALAPAAAAVCVKLSWLAALASHAPPPLRWCLLEARTLGMLGLLAGSVALGHRSARSAPASGADRISPRDSSAPPSAQK